jgi:hypothetical protein
VPFVSSRSPVFYELSKCLTYRTLASADNDPGTRTTETLASCHKPPLHGTRLQSFYCQFLYTEQRLFSLFGNLSIAKSIRKRKLQTTRLIFFLLRKISRLEAFDRLLLIHRVFEISQRRAGSNVSVVKTTISHKVSKT